MRDVRHAWFGALAFCVMLLAMASTGCTTANTHVPRAAVAVRPASATQTAAAVAETSTVASVSEVTELLSSFNQPEEPGDLGYALLGKEHNDIAGWTRTVVLAHTEYGRLVQSLLSQQDTVPQTAMAAFDREVASKGASATYDSVISSEWRVQDDKATRADKQLVSVIPASGVLSLLLDRQGRLLETYPRKSLAVSGTVATATYARPGAADIVLEFELSRDVDGNLRIDAWKNYAQFKRALKGNEIVDGMP